MLRIPAPVKDRDDDQRGPANPEVDVVGKSMGRATSQILIRQAVQLGSFRSARDGRIDLDEEFRA
jgi:hypothetical protein